MTKRMQVAYANLGFKFLYRGGAPIYGTGTYAKYMPRGGQPGRWKPSLRGEIKICKRGYHIATPSGIATWAPSNYPYGDGSPSVMAFIAEIRGDMSVQDRSKKAGRSIRLLVEIPPTWKSARGARQAIVLQGILTKGGRISRRWLKDQGFEVIG